MCHHYWPNGKGMMEDYGKLSVKFKDQKVFSDYIMRKFEIIENQPHMSVTSTGTTITQFHYLRWQEDAAPNSTSAILEIANLVQKVQMSTGNKPIVVMCKYVQPHFIKKMWLIQLVRNRENTIKINFKIRK